MLDLQRALLVVRDLRPGQSTDPDGAEYDPGAGGPETGAWPLDRYGTSQWYEATTPTGERVLAYRVNTDPAGTRGLFAVFGSTTALATIEAVADLAMPAVEAWRRRAEAGVLLYLRSWRTFRCQGFERDDAGDPVAFDDVRPIIDEGGRLPDYTTEPLPWDLAPDGTLVSQAAARYRVTGIDRPALGITVAGLGCGRLFEDQE